MSEIELTRARHLGSARTLTDTPSDSGANELESIARGTHVGRYVVLGKLGAGAMGVVFAAHDPELDRKVALKLLKPRGGDQDAARARLQREAQALAKLDHLNVVHVYDVGLHADRLFVAMEFVAGRTLGAWMRSAGRPHPWPEVVRVFVEAGRGLAAAHEVGMIHRDFKPDNVMIGEDGRVRVMDFGLARADAEGNLDLGRSHDQLCVTDKRALLETLTQTGALVGTPAYMAPELFKGAPADARSDQFGFCIALYEALHGERPFFGDSLPALLDALEREQIRGMPPESKVPSWLRKLILRGLAVDRERRWPSMQALVDALVETPRVRRRSKLAAVGLVGALAGALVLNSLEGESTAIHRCAEGSERVSAVWNGSVSARLAATITSHSELARRSWPHLHEQIDRWTERWAAVDLELCNRYGLGVAPALHERQLMCLDRQLGHFGIALDVLSTATADELEHGFDLLARLPDPDHCRGATTSDTRVDVDSQVVAELEAALARAELEFGLGRVDKADTASAELLAASNGPGFEELHVRVTKLRGDVLFKLDRREETIDVGFSGLAAAERNGGAELRLRAFANLAEIHINGQDLQGAERWLKQAKAIAAEQQADRRVLRDLAATEAWIAAVGGRLDESLAIFDRALALCDPASERLEHAQLTIARAQLLGWIGKAEQALEQFELGERELVELLGADHPTVLDLRNTKALIRMQARQWEPARTEMLAVAGSLEALRGRPTTLTVTARAHAAWLLDRLGDCEGARAEYDPLLPLARELLPYPSPDLGKVLTYRVQICGYRTPEAVDLASEALVLYHAAVGEQHVIVADAHKVLARAQFEAGELEDAGEEVETALAIFAAIDPIGAEFVTETRALAMLIGHARGKPGALDGIEEVLASLGGSALGQRLAALR